MKLTSAIVLVAIVGFAGYLWWFQPPWFWDLFNKGTQAAQGYLPAKTPNEAAEYFVKAINNRNYNSAGEYCKGEYGEALKKGHDAGTALGKQVDTINGLCNDKGINTDKAQLMLLLLDPFPPKLKIKQVSEPKDGKATVQLELDLITLNANPGEFMNQVDEKMFHCNLMPAVDNPKLFIVNLVEEGEGDQKQWKIDIPLTPVMRDRIDLLVKNHKTYITGMEDVAIRIRASGGITNKSELDEDLTEALTKAK